MTELTPIRLGACGVQYIKAEFEVAGSLLKAALGKFGSSGECFSIAPVGTSLARAIRFDDSFPLWPGSPNLWLGNYITQKWGADCCQLFAEAPWYSRDEAQRRPPSVPYFWFQEKLYYSPQKGDHGLTLEAGLHEMHDFVTRGVVLRSFGALPMSGSEVSDAYVATLIQNCVAAFASAYDQESYVVWERGD